MPDFVVVQGKTVQLPPECEHDMAARAAVIQKLLNQPEPPAAPPKEKE